MGDQRLVLRSLLLHLPVLFLASRRSFATGNATKCDCNDDAVVNRGGFPDGFVFGASGSAYQFEGAYNQDGKGLSNWDYYTHAHPERIVDGSNGDVAINSYMRYKEDVHVAKEMGSDAYRFSISWARILPNGSLFGGHVNSKGIEYYNNLIDELLRNGIEPYVTLFHWDVPLMLDKHYGGFLSRRIVEDFHYYADVCFKHFGSRVKNWITINEPWTVSYQGYADGSYAPGRCSNHTSCLGGDSGTEPYIVAHHLLLAHAAAVQLYKQKYQARQNGSIGIAVNSNWFLPYSNSTLDQLAPQRALDFGLGWFMDPLTFGKYPKSMRRLVGSRLPTFTPIESRMIKGSFDFIGLQYYGSYYAKDAASKGPFNCVTDSQVIHTGTRDGVPIGKKADVVDWLYIYPRGIWALLDYVRRTYNDPPIIITENGVCEANIPTMKLEEALIDNARVDYIQDHLCCVLRAIKDGVRVKGYFVWSLLDNYEWASGYTVRFGLNYVDFKNDLQRYPKKSALWLKSILSRESTILAKDIKFVGENNSSLSFS